ncbi:MAG: phage portal protein [Pseudomonadota bacterium]
MSVRTARARYRIKGTGVYVDAFTQPIGGGAGHGQPYDAAGEGRRATTWRVSQLGPKSTLSYSLPTLRNRARDAVRKNPLADSAISTIETNIVGSGIKPLFRTSDAGLNKELQELWLDWTDEADADGRCDFYGLQASATRAMAEAGEAFARMRMRRLGDMDTVPVQVQLLEAEYCPTDQFHMPAVERVIDGIEFDAIGKRSAYWLYRQHPQDWSVNQAIDLTPRRVPATEVAHIYSARRPGQIRGEPWLTRALIKLRDLDTYDDAELERKKTAAMIAGFIIRPDENGQFAGEREPDSDGVATATWEPGTIQFLGTGEDVKFSTPTDVGGQYEVFMREQKRALAVAAGILYEQLTGDYGEVNDRTFRASVNEFRRRAQMWQHHLVVFQLCRPIARRWLDAARLSGAISVPRTMETRDFYRIKWIPEGWSYIHPVQEVQANQMAVRSGFKSRAQVVSEQGYDVEEVDDEIAKDQQREKQLELKFDSNATHGKAGAGAGSGTGSTGPAEADSEETDAEETEREREDA